MGQRKTLVLLQKQEISHYGSFIFIQRHDMNSLKPRQKEIEVEKNTRFCLSLFWRHKLNSISVITFWNHSWVFYHIICTSIHPPPPTRPHLHSSSPSLAFQHQYPTIIHWWLNLKLLWRQVFNIPSIPLIAFIYRCSTSLPNRNLKIQSKKLFPYSL